MRTLIYTLALLSGLAAAPLASAHAFPDHSSPTVGATVATAPRQVRVWFDGDIEPVFSTLTVKSASGRQVSTGKGKVDAKNHTLLEASLPTTLPAGKYTVFWSVIARDGHHTEGHFAFTVK